MTTQILAIAIPAALVAALCFGVTGVWQQRSTHRVAERSALRFGLLLDLVRQPLWLASIGLDVVGAVAQAVALATGSVALVQPILVLSLVFAVLVAAWMARARPDRVLLLGSLLCGAGLAVFLVLARPHGGTQHPGIGSVLPLAVGLVVVVLCCLAVAARYRGQARALALATSCGILYGVTAGLGKMVLDSLDEGLLALFTGWPVYALAVVGLLGFLLNQNAFQAARTIATVLAVITIMDPLAGVAVGIVWLHERVSAAPAAVVGEVLAMVVMALGVVVLARRSPAVAPAGDAERPPVGTR